MTPIPLQPWKRDILIYLSALFLVVALVVGVRFHSYVPGRTITVENCAKWMQLRVLLNLEKIRHQILPTGDVEIHPDDIDKLAALGGGNVFSLIDDPAPGAANTACPQRDLAAGRAAP